MDDAKPEGLANALRRMADSLLAIAQNRLELFSVEAGEEKLRLIEALFLAVAFFFIVLLALLVLTLGLIFLAPPEWRPWVLGGFVLVYFSASGVIWIALGKRIRNWPPPFSSTLAEFKKDLECLRPKK
jgi:uncharacterized membrane protein YqjE